VGDYKTPFGLLGDLIRATPRELISQVFLEDILYETWAHERVALIGDGKFPFVSFDATTCALT
jgi:hypothetical protein